MENIETKIEELRKEFNSKLDEILKPKFEVGKKYLIINGCNGVRVLDGKICTFINKPKTKPNYYAGCIFECSEYFFIHDDIVYGFIDVASYEIVKTKNIDEIAEDYLDFTYSGYGLKYSKKDVFKLFLTENKQDIINALNNL